MPAPLVDDRRWTARAARARILTRERPEASESLAFYAALADTQAAILRDHVHAISGGSGLFVDRLDCHAAAGALPQLVRALVPHAPAALRTTLDSTDGGDPRWTDRVQRFWTTAGREATGELEAFMLEALLQPFAEAIAGGSDVPGHPTDANTCPICTAAALVATLREQSHGARRSLVCGLCLTEWPVLRLQCLACGETRFEGLPVFRAGELEAARIDACDTCRSYVKTIDLTRDAGASPIVDDVASVALDVWAREQGYRRVRPNVLRM